MINKIIAGAFSVLIGSMAVKVFKAIKDGNQEEIIEEVVVDELQD